MIRSVSGLLLALAILLGLAQTYLNQDLANLTTSQLKQAGCVVESRQGNGARGSYTYRVWKCPRTYLELTYFGE